jgi:hypothetical protein
MTATRERPAATGRGRCPRHPACPLAYGGPGVTWDHTWACPRGCAWAATSVAAPLVAGRPGIPPGTGYLTWEQWRIFEADTTDRTWEEKIRAAYHTTA